ncbi:membrane protein [Psychromonas marina]|uniref:Membrane protein n=1 Tax=Psychromonas marina TaxID=88364 RepID=A0ABQ6E1W7_9GAMM|nr:YoaK family protein [Psychromonas marina]GLS91021.1 membrane protein [Psychromonas marina]
MLALVAGFVNAIGLLGFNHQPISHLSGTATLIGTEIADGSLTHVFHLVMVVISFLVGAAISGFVLRSGALKLGRHYSKLLFIEALCLFAATYLLTQNSEYGLYLASAACGLQNAMVTTFSGAVIRTTHVTGIFTDLGIMIGAKFRGEVFDKRKATLFLLIISGFIAGGTLGATVFAIYQFKALLIPAMICLSLAISYSIYTAKAGHATNHK